MGSDDVVYGTLLKSGLKGTKVAWPIKGAPPLPWFTYRRAKGGEVFADDETYANIRRYEIDLYQAEKDDDVRDLFEEHVALLGPYASYEEWIQHENCWRTAYTLTFHPKEQA